MKSLIVYYSQTGNTAGTAIILSNILKEKGEVKILSLEVKSEIPSFFKKCRSAFFRKRVQINEVPTDISSYDLFCIGSPVWALHPVPAINTYLDQIEGVAGKEAIAFVTYGSGLGKSKALKCMKNSLLNKGVSRVKTFSVSQFHSKDSDYIRKILKDLGI